MHFCELTVQLGRNMEADVTVYFEVDSPGYPGDRFDPAEPPEFYVTDFEIDTLYGDGYEKSTWDLLDGGWCDIAERAVEVALENYDLYYHQLDAYGGEYDD